MAELMLPPKTKDPSLSQKKKIGGKKETKEKNSILFYPLKSKRAS